MGLIQLKWPSKVARISPSDIGLPHYLLEPSFECLVFLIARERRLHQQNIIRITRN